MKARVEWRRAPDFAEIAEALGIKTTQIMGAMNPQENRVLVLYTPYQDERIFSIRLRRDNDGILVHASVPTEHEGMWEEVLRRLEGEL